ncbi:hypothetical protein FQR65_LT18917 [Abscondita terminalis]|nr:hypothetical protein FQR65_LT18917 [Abscondita terminalis]
MTTDVIADMLTRIRNANQRMHKEVMIPGSKIKLRIAEILLEEGFIEGFTVEKDFKKNIIIALKYRGKQRVIKGLTRISKPGLRVYSQASNVPKVLNGLGPKGELTKEFFDCVEIKVEGTELKTIRKNELKTTKQLHGTTNALLDGMLVGVSQGFVKELEIVGVGYRAALAGNKLNLSLGYSHPVEHLIPAGITVEVPKPTHVIISGHDKQLVGEIAAQIRAYRKPEPYKGKGIKYKGVTLVASSSMKLPIDNKSDINAAIAVGKDIAEKAKSKKITNVVFDRGGYLFHGKVKAFAESVKENVENVEKTAKPAFQPKTEGKPDFKNKSNNKEFTPRNNRDGNFKKFNKEDNPFEEKVVTINRITKVTKGGRRFRFAAVVIIGDKKGRVGLGTGKANEVPDAIKKAIKDARKQLVRIQMVGTTVPHD